jgi:hypothetical protein
MAHPTKFVRFNRKEFWDLHENHISDVQMPLQKMMAWFEEIEAVNFYG